MINKNLEKKIKEISRNAVLGLAGAGIFIGLYVGIKYIDQGLKKIENSEYIKNLRKENKKDQIFEEKVHNAMKNSYNVTGYDRTGYYLDIDGDRNPDVYVGNPPFFPRGFGVGPLAITKIQK